MNKHYLHIVILYTVIIFITYVNVVISRDLKKLQNEYLNELEIAQTKCDSRTKDYEHFFKSNINNNTLFFCNFKKEIQVCSKNEISLICRISERNCSDCVEYALAKLVELKKTRPNISIKIFADYSNLTALKHFSKQYNLDIKMFETVRNLGHEIDKSSYPYFFFLSEEGYISNLFFPNKNNHEFTNHYFKLLETNFN